MNKRELAEEIRKLSDLLSSYQDAYNKKESLVSDFEYDMLFDKLSDLENKNPLFRLPNSPTARVGSDLSNEIPEVEHSIPVLSLDKGYTVDSIREWMDKTVAKAGNSLSFIVEKSTYRPPGIFIFLIRRRRSFRNMNFILNFLMRMKL